MKEYARFKVCKWSYFVFLLLFPVIRGTCPIISNRCEMGWVFIGGACYLIPDGDIKMNYTSAAKICEQMLARLPVFVSNNEYVAFSKTTDRFKFLRKSMMWLGIQYNPITNVFSYKSFPSGQVCSIENGDEIFYHFRESVINPSAEICVAGFNDYDDIKTHDELVLQDNNCSVTLPFSCQKLLYSDDCIAERTTANTTQYLTTFASSSSSKSMGGNNLTQIQQATSAQSENGHTNCIIVAVSVQIVVLCLFFLVFIIYKRKKTNEIKQKDALYVQLSSKRPASPPRMFAIGSGANSSKSIAYPTNRTLRTSKKNSPPKYLKMRGDILSKKNNMEHSCATETATSRENSKYETIQQAMKQ